MTNSKDPNFDDQDDKNNFHNNPSPATADEQSMSGSTPDPESDDNALDAAQDAGLYEEADEEHPVELNLAGEIEKDERLHQEED